MTQNNPKNPYKFMDSTGLNYNINKEPFKFNYKVPIFGKNTIIRRWRYDV